MKKSNQISFFTKLKIAICFVFFQSNIYSQLNIINTKSPNQLVTDVLIGNGVEVSNVTFKGDKSTGICEFTYNSVVGSNNLGIDKGIFLSTGNVQNAVGKNISQSTGSQGSNVSDKDLDSIIQATGKKTTDATVIEFDFIPMSDSIQFKYVFASEEYPEFNCSSFNDVFAFLLSGPNPTGGNAYKNINLAVVPGTNTNVSVNTINSGTVSGVNTETICDNIDPNWKNYTKYFVPNYPNLPKSDQLTFDGYTVPLEARAAVKCGETYHMKIAVADVGDQNYDSGVFLLANSLFSNIVTAETKQEKNDLSVVSDSIIVENCTKGIVTFKLGKKSTQNTQIDYTLSGTATNGVDYQNLPGTITIPANTDSIQLIITPITDNITEGDEKIILEYNAGGCAGKKSKTFTLRDTPVPPVTDFSYDTLICLNSPEQYINRATNYVKGGVFSCPSPDLALNTSTGKITPNLSKPGVYNVTYTVSQTNSCDVAGQSTIQVTIESMKDPNTNFTYPTPICQGESSVSPNLSLNFTQGGVFYAKSNVIVDSTSGSINLKTSNPGFHTIYYKFEQNECYNAKLDSVEIEIIENPSPIPGFSYASPICLTDANPLPTVSNGFITGGIYQCDSINLIFKDNKTGEIDLSKTKKGSYTIFYEITNNKGCTTSTDKVNISIIDQLTPGVTFNYDNVLCTGSGKKSPILGSNFTSGGLFSSNNIGLKIDQSTGELDLDNSLKGTYNVTYSFPKTNCSNFIDTTITITIDSLILKNTDFSYDSPICITGSNPLPKGNYDSGGEFSATQGVSISKNSGKINLAGTLAGSYDIKYTIQASGCYAKSESTFKITIESSNTPIVNFSYERPMCLNTENTNPLLPNGFSTGGVFASLSPEISIDSVTGKLNLTNAKGGNTYQVNYTITSSACGGSGVGVTEILIAELSKPITDFDYGNANFCVNTTNIIPTLSANFEQGGTFSSFPKGLIIDSITGEVDFIHSPKGTYKVKYFTPEKVCIAKDSTEKELIISDLPIVSITKNNPICIGDSLLLKAPSYIDAAYKWSGPNNFISNDSTPILTPLKMENKGTYKVIVTRYNCSDSSSILVDIKDVENINIPSIGPFCKSDSNSYTLQSPKKGGIWNGNGFTLDAKDSSIIHFKPSSSTEDSLLITYTTKEGCGGLGTLRIINNSLPITNFDINSKEGCAPINVKLLLSQNSNLDSCIWYIDNERIDITKDSTIKFSKQGYFNVKVTSFKNGCFSSLQKDTILKVYPYPIADFDVQDTIISQFTPTVTLFNKSTNATINKWSFSDGYNTTVKNPTHIFPLDANDYFITLFVSQKGFCDDSKTIHINIPNEMVVYVPNSFTPNDDNLNEEFLPIISNTIDPTSYTLTIFNRWGEIVFISHDKSVGWRGTYGGQVCLNGVYTWKIDFTDNIKKQPHNYVGHVSLVK